MWKPKYFQRDHEEQRVQHGVRVGEPGLPVDAEPRPRISLTRPLVGREDHA